MPFFRFTLFIPLCLFTFTLRAGEETDIQALVSACKTKKAPVTALVVSGPENFQPNIEKVSGSLRYVIGKKDEDPERPTTEQAIWDYQENKLIDFRPLYRGTPKFPTVKAVSEKTGTAVIVEATRKDYQAPYTISLYDLNKGTKTSVGASQDWVHGRQAMSPDESKLLVIPSAKQLGEITVVDLNSPTKKETKYQLELPDGEATGILEPTIDNSGTLLTARLAQSGDSNLETILWKLDGSSGKAQRSPKKALLPALNKDRKSSSESKEPTAFELEGMPLGTTPDGKWIMTSRSKGKLFSLYKNTSDGIKEVPVKGTSELHDNLQELKDRGKNPFTDFGAKDFQITKEGYLVLHIGYNEQKIERHSSGIGVGGPTIEHTVFARWHLDHLDKSPEVFEVPLTGRAELVHAVTYKVASDGRILAAGINPKGLYFWDADSGKTIQVPRKNEKSENWQELAGDLKFSEDGSKLMISGLNGVEVVDLINVFKKQNPDVPKQLALPAPEAKKD